MPWSICIQSAFEICPYRDYLALGNRLVSAYAHQRQGKQASTRTVTIPLTIHFVEQHFPHTTTGTSEKLCPFESGIFGARRQVKVTAAVINRKPSH